MNSYSALCDARDALAKRADDPKPVMGLSGTLVASSSGWLLLSVPNAFVRGLFDSLDEPGIELPLKDGSLNAHISVMRPAELERIGGLEKITERGKRYRYTIEDVETVKPAGWAGVDRVWFVKVRSPELRALRRSYGLSDLPNENRFAFHVTFAVRRAGVLRAGETAKAATDEDLDNCPTCEARFTGRCRCMIGNKFCEKGHQWWACYVHKRRFVGTGHEEGLPAGGRATCKCPGGKAAEVAPSSELVEIADIARAKHANEDEDRPYTVAVDFDGTLAASQSPFNPETAGEPIESTVLAVRELKAAGARVVIFTVRGNVGVVRAWCTTHDVPVDYINENPDQPPDSSGKVYADAYLDDRAWNVKDLAAVLPRFLAAAAARAPKDLPVTDVTDAFAPPDLPPPDGSAV